eukprot:UN06286
MKRFHMPRISIFNRDESNSKAVRKSVTKSNNTNSKSSKPYQQHSTLEEEEVDENKNKMQTHLLVQQSNGTPTPSEENINDPQSVNSPNPVEITFDRYSVASNSITTVSVESNKSQKSKKRHSHQLSQDDSCLG